MGSDRARSSYDKRKQYRRVVPQQGRVVLEADTNEAAQILTEETRHEVLDIVGPAGVPSDPITLAKGTGYAITSPALGPPSDFSIGQGVIYVGGWRVEQPDASLTYTTQIHGDWLDQPNPPDVQPDHEAVYLRLREQEVSATEDSTLIEVALGGPDTAQRVRLVRRVERQSSVAADCTAFNEVVEGWKAQGIIFDPDDMRLARTARLSVKPEPVSPPPGPCDPAATSGYLGAENQMLRVQVVSATQLVWGYDDASFLYRASLSADRKTLTLQSIPVDAYHQPRAGQVVEVLLPAVDLENGDYMAASSGVVTTLQRAYQPDGTVLLVAALPGSLASAPVLFVRVWENQQTFAAGAALSLVDQTGTDIGLQVTLTGGPFVVGDFWFFAVRPTTPESVYPARYLTPQPPEGPREWACPLAAIDWTTTTGNSDTQTSDPTVSDCRLPFENLVTLTRPASATTTTGGGCCTVTVGPKDLTGNATFQAILKNLPKQGTAKICLQPGLYTLTDPLRLDAGQTGLTGLTIEACNEGACLQAQSDSDGIADGGFIEGLLVLSGVNDVSIRGLCFILPQVQLFVDTGDGSVGAGSTPDQTQRSEDLQNALDVNSLGNLIVSNGIRQFNCTRIAVQDCSFSFPVTTGPTFGAGIFANGDATGLDVRGNVFQVASPAASTPNVWLFGYLLTPAQENLQAVLDEVGQSGPALFQVLAETGSPALLTAASLRQNVFSGLTAGALLFAGLGAIRLDDNQIRDGYGGLWIFTQYAKAWIPPSNLPLDAANAISNSFADQNLIWSVLIAGALLAPLAVSSPPPPPPLSPPATSGLHLADNTIDNDAGGQGAGTALLAWYGDERGSSAIVSANRMTNRAQRIPTALLVGLNRCSVTGNVMANVENSSDSDEPPCLIVAPVRLGSASAVTGNVLVGINSLPPWPDSPSQGDWSPLNSHT